MKSASRIALLEADVARCEAALHEARQALVAERARLEQVAAEMQSPYMRTGSKAQAPFRSTNVLRGVLHTRHLEVYRR